MICTMQSFSTSTHTKWSLLQRLTKADLTSRGGFIWSLNEYRQWALHILSLNIYNRDRYTQRHSNSLCHCSLKEIIKKFKYVNVVCVCSLYLISLSAVAIHATLTHTDRSYFDDRTREHSSLILLQRSSILDRHYDKTLVQSSHWHAHYVASQQQYQYAPLLANSSIWFNKQECMHAVRLESVHCQIPAF